jgi:hypothetical protein
MKIIKQWVALTVVAALAVFGLIAPMPAQAQRRAYRMNDNQMQRLIRRIETRSDTFSNSLEKALDRSYLNGTSREDEVNKAVTAFEAATDQLRQRFDRRESTSMDVESVLRQAVLLDTFMRNNRMGGVAERDWRMLRNDLNRLANNYNVAWNWNNPPVNTYGGQIAYRITDAQMKQLIGRIETRTDRFSNRLSNSLDRSRYDGSQREDNLNRLLTDFENATDQLKKRFERRESTTTDVQAVLQRGALINTFMRNNRLNNRVENDWALLKGELDTLANAYSVAWNWDTIQTPVNNSYAYNTDTRMTGTFRLNAGASDNPEVIADRALVAQNLNYSERQRIRNNLVTRLSPPEMIAVERRGLNVTLASSKSPQVAIDVDGREHFESYPNGRRSNVRATFSGDTLTVTSNGDRLNDFTATFAPLDNGRRLLVTRSVYAERLSQPVVVRSYYDRTSDVAQFNVYQGTTAYTGTVGSNFLVPDGTQLVAVLNNNLTTSGTTDNARFTMTVREPSQYRNAVLEGYVSDVSRGGRITGRSEMTLNFDTIRLGNGQTYRFAGVLENVRTMGGESVRVDNEGSVQEGDSRTSATTKRTAIGGAIGALIGAIAGGGTGAAIGAIVGAGAGAGSVYVQGRDDLELMSGTEMTIRASAPRSGY